MKPRALSSQLVEPPIPVDPFEMAIVKRAYDTRVREIIAIWNTRDIAGKLVIPVYNLAVHGSPVYLRLPALKTVEAYVDINHESPVEILDLPALESVGYIAVEGVGVLSVLSMPHVTRTENVRIRSNPKLRKIDLANLRTVRGPIALAVDIASNPSLSTLNLVALTEAGGIGIRENDSLPGLRMPVLTTVEGGFEVSYSHALAELAVPLLNLVTGEMAIHDTALSVLSAPLTSADSLKIIANSKLTSLTLPLLTSIQRTVSISYNELLPTSQAQAIVDHLVGFKGTAAIFDNAPWALRHCHREPKDHRASPRPNRALPPRYFGRLGLPRLAA